MGLVQKRLWFSICVLCFCFFLVCGVEGDNESDKSIPEKVPEDVPPTPPEDDKTKEGSSPAFRIKLGEKAVAETDENYVCATLDLWPETKCNFGDCPWEKSSILNLDLNNTILKNAVIAFGTLRMRLGGTLQDRLIYQTQKDEPCEGFSYNPAQTLDFSQACLSLERWDQINSFIKKTGAEAVFGLNALKGKDILIHEEIDGESKYTAVGDWDSSNSESLIKYSVEKGYHKHIIGWTLGNELGGRTLYLHVPAHQYVIDTQKLHSKIKEIYHEAMPKIIAPGAIFDTDWFKEYIEATPEDLDVATHHMYNLLSPENDEKLKERILTASFFDKDTEDMFVGLKNILEGKVELIKAQQELEEAEKALEIAEQEFQDAEVLLQVAEKKLKEGKETEKAHLEEAKNVKLEKLKEAEKAKETASNVKDTKDAAVTREKESYSKKQSKAVAWIGESGGAFHSGRRGISNAFINGFWYLNMLGFAARHNTKTYCRQTLIGGNYGLLDTNTYIPNPDYYNALLWHKLMGKKVLLTKYEETTPKNVYTYAHCEKNNKGVSILVLNQDEKIPFKASFDVQKYGNEREEYRLTPVDGDILSREVKLNGNLLHVGPTGVIPAMEPLKIDIPHLEGTAEPKDHVLEFAQLSIVFLRFPKATFPACSNQPGV